jgi:hypothetical protein
MFIEGETKRKWIANRIVKIYHYEETLAATEYRTYDIIYDSTTILNVAGLRVSGVDPA